MKKKKKKKKKQQKKTTKEISGVEQISTFIFITIEQILSVLHVHL